MASSLFLRPFLALPFFCLFLLGVLEYTFPEQGLPQPSVFWNVRWQNLILLSELLISHTKFVASLGQIAMLTLSFSATGCATAADFCALEQHYCCSLSLLVVLFRCCRFRRGGADLQQTPGEPSTSAPETQVFSFRSAIRWRHRWRHRLPAGSLSCPAHAPANNGCDLCFSSKDVVLVWTASFQNEVALTSSAWNLHCQHIHFSRRLSVLLLL